MEVRKLGEAQEVRPRAVASGDGTALGNPQIAQIKGLPETL